MKQIYLAMSFSTLAVLFFFHTFLFHLDQTTCNHNDACSAFFILKTHFDHFSHRDFSHLFESQMFHPEMNTLALGHSLFIPAIEAYPLFLFSHNLIFSTNAVLIIHFFLAFIGAYLLCYKLGKNISASVIGALIYSYNPFIMSHFPEQYEITTHQFLPFFFLFLEYWLETGKFGAFLGAALTLLLQIIAYFYYSFFLLVLLPLFLLVRLPEVKKRLQPTFLLKAAITFCLLLLPLYWYISPYLQMRKLENLTRPLSEVAGDSARPSDYFFTFWNNWLYGKLNANRLLASIRYPLGDPRINEHSLFPGLTVYVLFIGSLIFLIKKKLWRHNPKIFSYVLLLVVSVILSFGPYARIFGLQINLPFYYVHQFLPFAQSMRVPTRVAVFAFLALAILASYFWSSLWAKFSFKKMRILSVLVIIFLLIEYFSVGPATFSLSSDYISFFSWLNAQQSVKGIVSLPMANGLFYDDRLVRDSFLDTQYIYYATFHDKKMVNGYMAFIPKWYYRLGNYLDYKIDDKIIHSLRSRGIDLLIVHKDEYIRSEIRAAAITRIEAIVKTKVFENDTVVAYKLN